MKFTIKKAEKKLKDELICDDEGYSFFSSVQENSSSSVLINCLELGFEDDAKKINSVNGWCPLDKYTETNELPDKYEYSDLYVELDQKFVIGVGYRFNTGMWSLYINKKQGWVCLGTPKVEGYKLIEFLPSCVATFDGEDLIAICQKNCPITFMKTSTNLKNTKKGLNARD